MVDTFIWKIVVICVLLTISAIAKAIQDTLQFHYWRSVFAKAKNEQWWNSAISWENKYTWFPKSKTLTWLISNPLVFITDAWHTFQLIRDLTIFSCIPIAFENYWLFLLYIPYRLIFHVLYSYLFTKHK